MSEPTNVGVPVMPPAMSPKPQGFAVAGLVLGIIGCVPCFWCVAPLCATLGIIFSSVALGRVRAGTGSGEGLAKAGLVCGIVGLVFFFLFILFLFISDCVVVPLLFRKLGILPGAHPVPPR